MKNKVYGSGGGGKGGGGDAPTESPDSLQSRQKARIVEILSEGELDAVLVDGLKSVYLNDVPIQNANGSYNFEGVSLVTASGTPLQDYIPGFSETESEHQVGVQVQNGVPYTFQVPNRDSSSADAIRVTVGIPGLSFITEDGDIVGTNVSISIEVQNDGGGFVNKITDTISGKTTSRYQRSYRIQLPAGENGPWDVRIIRNTADSGSAKLVNGTYLDTYTIISETKMRYSNSAVVGIEINSEQFSSVPVRGYHSRGIKIKVPTNYNPTTRTYTGLWDGTFKTVYSNNPAWVLYDLLTMDRYGLGKYIDPSLIDRWTLYSIAQYCDQLVPNGYGGTEPRYTCNLYIQERSEAFTLISNMASIAHMATYGGGGGIAFVQDAPRDPIALYTPANVIDGKFEYTGASIKAQHNVVLVAWNDPADKYRQKIEYVEDADSIAKYGIVQKEVVAMGCTSRGQARRFGKAILFAEKFESEGIAFSAAFDSYKIYPGAVFNVADPHRSEVRNGGRLLSATSSSVELDSPVDIGAGIPHTLKVVLPDGSVATRTVASSGTGLTTLVVTSPFTYIVEGATVEVAPVPMAMWILESTDKETESWVCLSAEENHDTGDIAIVGMAYRPEKFGYIDSNEPLPPTPEYNPYQVSPPPTNLSVGAYLNINGGVDVICSWEAASGTRFASVAWRRDNENFEVVPAVYGNSFTIKNASIGSYTFIVSTVNSIGVASPGANITYGVTSVSILPDITSLQLKQPFVDQFASFEWAALASADSYRVQVVVGGIVKREVIVADNWYTYDYAESVADGAGTPFRDFDLRVKAKFGTLESGNWVTLSVSNAAPAAPALTVVAITGGFQASAPMPSDTDYAGMVVWASTTQDFVPSGINQVYDGPNNSANLIGWQPGVPVYVRAAFYDVYGKSGLNISSEYNVSPLSNVADIPVVTVLPASGMTIGQVVYLLSDEKLYRYTADGWVTWVDGADILAASITAGQISVINLATLSANMGTITAGNITLDQFGFVQGGQSGYRTGNGFWMGYNGATYKWSLKGASGVEFVFDGNNIVLYDSMGNAILSALGGVPYSSVTGTPSTLSDLDSAAATKLSGIDTGATRNAYLGEYSGVTTYQYGDVVTKDGSAWTYIYASSSTGNAPPNLPTTSNAWWGLYAAQGPQGADGVNGTRTAILDMYIAASSVPTTFPSGTSTYTWAIGQFTDPTTPNGWSRTPPTPGAGEVLYVTRQLYSDQNTSATSSVTWSSSFAGQAGGTNGVDGVDGTNGTRTAFLELYRWSATAPVTFPSGTSTYTWATGAFTAPGTPNGWSLTPGAAVAGQTLWACSVRYADTGVTTTSSVTWSTSTAYAIGAAGTDGSDAKLAVLTASSYVFQISKALVTTPSSITLTAYGQNVTGSPTFSVVSGTATLTGTGNTRSLSDVGLTTETATIKIVWDGQEDYVTIAKVREGADGVDGADGAAGATGANGSDGLPAITVVFSNESHTLPALVDGTVSSYLNSGSTVQVYEGTTLLNAGNLGNGSFTVGAPTQSPAATITPGSISYSGTTATIAAHASMTQGSTTVALTYPITVTRLNGSVVPVNRVQSITKSMTGAPGSNGLDGAAALTVIMSNEAHLLPATNTGSVTSYNGSGTTIQVYEGTTLLVAGGAANGSFTVGSITQSPLSTITPGSVTYSGNTATVAQHSAMVTGTDSVVLTIPITVKRANGTTSVINRVQTLAKSKSGLNGADGADGLPGPSVTVNPSRATTFTATDGTLDAAQANISFTASVEGIAVPTYVWSFSGFQSSPTNSGTSVQTITQAQFGTSKSATVTCTVNGQYVDVITVSRLEKSTAAAGADNTTNALTTGVTITSGGITIGSGGSLKGGQTDFNAGTGWFLGYSGGAYKFSIGNAAGSRMTWDGSLLSLIGASLDVSSTGAVKGGQTDFNTGIGFFIGYSGGTHKLSIGNPGGNHLKWDGTNLNIRAVIEKVYTAGSLILASALTSRSPTYNGTWQKMKEIAIDGAGTITAYFNSYINLQSTGTGATIYTEIRKNGVLVSGASYTDSHNYTYPGGTCCKDTAHSVNISVVSGDAIQIWARVNAGQPGANGVENFSLQAAQAPAPTVNQD